MIRTAVIALVALGLSPMNAMADEVWTNPAGDLIYEEDLGQIAVFSFPSNRIADGAPDPRARVYLPGLGGNFDNRSVHDGYWVVQGGPVCTASLTTPDGITTQRWGRAEVMFDAPGYPTGFTMMIGYCLDDPTIAMRAALF